MDQSLPSSVFELAALQLWAAAYAGLVVGGFLTVLAARLREHPHTGIGATVKLLSQPSCCAECNARVPFLDTIPLVGFLMRRGVCRFCGASISWRYPMTEAGALLALLVFCLPFVGRPEAWAAIALSVLVIVALGFASALHKMSAPLAALAMLAGAALANVYGLGFAYLGALTLPAALWSQCIRTLEARRRDAREVSRDPEPAAPARILRGPR